MAPPFSPTKLAKLAAKHEAIVIPVDRPQYPTLSEIMSTPQEDRCPHHSVGTTEDDAGPSFADPLADDSDSDDEDEGDDMDEDDPPKDEETKKTQTNSRKRYQGVSAKLNPFLKMKDKIQASIFAHQYDELVEVECPCGSNNKQVFRCMQCRHPPSCDRCIVAKHHGLPTHRIERWNGLFFTRSSLSEIGLVLNLGHRGKPCPLRNADAKRSITICDVNGYHSVDVLFCKCPRWLQVDHAEAEQLFEEQFWPATVERPETAMTFDVLDNFIIHANTSKKSVYDYCYALQRFTNPMQPDLSPNVYRNLKLAARMTRTLGYRRRSGQEHGIDRYITHRRPGNVSIHCPACPQPGFNLDSKVLEEAKEEEQHKYTLFLSGDGTFNAPRVKQKEDPNDEALNEGKAHLSDEASYQRYLDVCDGEPPEQCTCARLRAMKLQSLLKFVNLIVSGVVGVVCTRHVFFQDDGVCDMYGGERFCYGDRALVGSLAYQIAQRWVCFSYDIWCQYIIHLLERITREKFPDLSDEFWDLLERVRGGIPNLHILGHVALCRALYSYAHMKHVGKTCGETVETPWQETRICGGSIKHENHGQRHDDLDAAFEDWNFNKLVKLADAVADNYIEAVETYERLNAEQVRRTATVPPELLPKWIENYNKPLPTRFDKDIVDRFEANFNGYKVPSLKEFMDGLDEREKREKASLKPTPGFISGLGDLLQEGARLDCEQKKALLLAAIIRKNHHYVEESDRNKLDTIRRALYKDSVTWLEDICRILPSLRQELREISLETPEKAFLPLPSRLSPAQILTHNLAYAEEIEYKVREIQAHRILHDAREAVLIHAEGLKDKKRHLRGQGAATRGKRLLDRLFQEKKDTKALYNFVRSRLLRLGLSASDSTLRFLQESDMNVKNLFRAAQPGEARKEDSWLWTTVKPDGLTEDDEKEWTLEVKRVQWMRAQSELDRWKEEKEILEEENPRSQRSHEKTAEVWALLAAEHAKDRGKQAYAYKQFHFYETLRQRHVKEWARAKKAIEEKQVKSLVASAEQEMIDTLGKLHSEAAQKAFDASVAVKRNGRIDTELAAVAKRKKQEPETDEDEEEDIESEEEVPKKRVTRAKGKANKAMPASKKKAPTKKRAAKKTKT